MAKAILTPAQKVKYNKGMCITPYCIRPHKRGYFCFTCIDKKRIQKDPVKWSYKVLKNNAKRRGKVFTLTLERFRVLVAETDYMRKKGITCKSFHIDRIEEEKGYTDDNVQCIQLRANVQKYRQWKAADTSALEEGPAPF